MANYKKEGLAIILKKKISFILVLIFILSFFIAVSQSFANDDNSKKLEEIVNKNNAKITSNISKQSNEIEVSIPNEDFANFIDDIFSLSNSQQNFIEVKNIKEMDSNTKAITIEFYDNNEIIKNPDQANDDKDFLNKKRTFYDMRNDAELWNGLIIFISVVLPFLGICLVTLLIVIYRGFLEIKKVLT